jgi:hypothetical protein
MPPSNLGTVQRDLRYCRNLIQNDNLSDALGPDIMQENECLNLRSSCMTDVTIPHHLFIYPKRTDVFSAMRRLLKKETLYIFLRSP